MKINKRITKRFSVVLTVFVFISVNIFSLFFTAFSEPLTANEVSALIENLPDTYSGIPLINNNVEDFTNLTNVASVVKDTSVSFEGINPIKITSASGGATTSTKFSKTFSQSMNLTELTNIEVLLWFYEDDPKLKLNDLRIDFVTNSNNYFYKYVDTSYWNGCKGACRIRYDIADFLKVGNPDITNITAFNFRMTGVTNMIESLGIFSVSYNARSRPKVILTFDDGWQDNYDNAYPILEAQGFKGVSYAVSNFVQGNDPNYMRKSTLDILYNAGWDISNHSKNHENYLITPGVDAKTMGASFKTCLDYLLSCGYEKSARFVCYPDGSFDDELIPYIKDIGIVSARTTKIGFNDEPTVDLYKLKQVTIGPNTTFGINSSANDIKASIDRAVSTGQNLTIMMHRISLDSEMNTLNDSTNSIKTSVTMLTQIAQYLKSTNVQVLTMSEWYNGLASVNHLTYANKDEAVSVLNAYNQLPDDQKALVLNFKKLYDAYAKITQLENSVNVIKNYSVNNNATSLTISQLLVAGVTKAYEENLSLYKTAIENSSVSSVDSTAKIQAIINLVNSPIVTINEYQITPTNQNITVTAVTNKGSLNTNSHTFSGNGSFVFLATDLDGNITAKTVNITNIDKTPPIVLGVTNNTYYSESKKITFNEGTATLNGISFNSGNTVSKPDNYILTVTDLAGNSTSITFSITQKGDINKDGKITAVDVLLVIKAILKKISLTEEQVFSADVNNDGKINILDALKILKFALGKINSF